MVWKFGKKQIISIFIVAIVIAGAILYTKFLMPNSADVKDSVKKLYELANPGSVAEVITLSDDSGLYKAVIKLNSQSGPSYAEIWVTKDGKYLTQNMIFVEDSVTQIENYKNFVDCLDSKGLKIFGVTDEKSQGGTATLMQLNLLGIYSPKIFVSCDGEQASNCANLGITQVPTISYDGKGYVGVRSVNQLSEMTSCKLG